LLFTWQLGEAYYKVKGGYQQKTFRDLMASSSYNNHVIADKDQQRSSDIKKGSVD